MLRYFINPILQVTPDGDMPMFECRIVDDHYKEIYRETLDEETKDAFEQIMASDKGAVLNFKHEKLAKLAQFKIDAQKSRTIVDGTRFP